MPSNCPRLPELVEFKIRLIKEYCVIFGMVSGELLCNENKISLATLSNLD